MRYNDGQVLGLTPALGNSWRDKTDDQELKCLVERVPSTDGWNYTFMHALSYLLH